MNPDNARILRITAAAGTELADAYSRGNCNGARVHRLIPPQKRFTTRRASFPHAAWLGQGSPHCPIFLTAASRRSLVRVSVPVWGTILSDPLAIVALVGRRPANKLMARMPVPRRRVFHRHGMPHGDRVRYYPAFPPAVPQRGVGCIRVTHPCATLGPPKGASRTTCMY